MHRSLHIYIERTYGKDLRRNEDKSKMKSLFILKQNFCLGWKGQLICCATRGGREGGREGGRDAGEREEGEGGEGREGGRDGGRGGEGGRHVQMGKTLPVTWSDEKLILIYSPGRGIELTTSLTP